MQTDRKKLGIFIIAIGLIILLLIIYFGFIRKKSGTTVSPGGTETPAGQLPSEPEKGTTTPGDKPRNYQQYDISKEAPHQFNENDLAKMAMSFSERFGSYSNQSSYGNFTDLKIFMTDSMKTGMDKYVANLKAQEGSNSAYYGITTKALTPIVKKFDDKAGEAQVTVTTQRSESTEKIGGGSAYIQKIDLTMVKVGGEWLVDKAYWEKK